MKYEESKHQTIYMSLYLTFYFFRFSDNYVIVPIFYCCLITICTCGQLAIFFKKRIENNIDSIQPKNANNQQWNNYICSNFWLIFLIILLFTIGMGARFVSVLISTGSGLSEEEYIQLKYQSVQLIHTIVPLFMYVKNDKLFKHVKTEIMAWFE